MTAEVSEEAARQIYQASLDKITKSYFDDDFDSFQANLSIPYTYVAPDGTKLVITNAAQTRDAFNCFRDYLLGAGVTHYVRDCMGAMFLEDKKIIGGHVSQFLQNGTQVREPYDVMMVIELIDGAWRTTSSECSPPKTAWPAVSFRQRTEN